MVVASGEFVAAAETQATSLGFADIACVYTPHPVQDRTDEEMRAYADRSSTRSSPPSRTSQPESRQLLISTGSREGPPRHGADDAIDEQPVRSLKGAHGSVCDWTERPVDEDPEAHAQQDAGQRYPVSHSRSVGPMPSKPSFCFTRTTRSWLRRYPTLNDRRLTRSVPRACNHAGRDICPPGQHDVASGETKRIAHAEASTRLHALCRRDRRLMTTPWNPRSRRSRLVTITLENTAGLSPSIGGQRAHHHESRCDGRSRHGTIEVHGASELVVESVTSAVMSLLPRTRPSPGNA